MSEVTYIFRDGKTYAIRQGKVIAASADPDEVERQVQAFAPPDVHSEGDLPTAHPTDDAAMFERDSQPEREAPYGAAPCPQCGAQGGTNFCPECGTPLAHGVDAPQGQEMGNPYPYDEPSPGIELGGEAGSYRANTVTTPNGLKGTVLGKVASLWGDEVTVRLENGRIVKLPVGTELSAEKTASGDNAGPSPIERLEARLAATSDGTRDSLVARSNELEAIKKEASHSIREGASWADTQRLDTIVVTADVEQGEITDAVAHLDDVDSIAAPGFSMGVAEDTPGISREDASWLENTVDQMVADAESTDYQKLMDEGPEAFAAELPDVALADTGTTREMASNFIGEKTAGVAREIADPYMNTFLARVEECRCNELSNRKQTTQKEAAAEEDKYGNLPDESLFL